jgi:hypothetical protein
VSSSAQTYSGCAGLPSAFFFVLKMDGMPLRLLQNHLRDVEQRIRPARHLDLARQGFNALFLRTQAEVNFRQRRRRRAPFAGVAPAEIDRSGAAEGLAALAFGPWRAAPRSGWAATIAARTIVISSRSGRGRHGGAAGDHDDRGRRGGRAARFRLRIWRTWRQKALAPKRARRVCPGLIRYPVMCSLRYIRRILRRALLRPLIQHGAALVGLQASAGIIPIQATAGFSPCPPGTARPNQGRGPGSLSWRARGCD